ncbi:HAD-IIB family hydrolase [Evtepia sp.]|uniref:HAD-IIB family hydrolase n=1 Tax=Evtepia sp. TaxID=2773933 RepID=UPI002E79DDEE|nr:HAD-IIB family hydrolase [Evtepia sp.]MEE0749040.1 HAD-IIB family hydrolase [Evtepia sp.]
MGKFDGVLLVSDFDDTLYGPDLRVPPANVEAIDYFVKGGGTFTVATGRAHPTFAPHAQCVAINAPVILSNGSALYDFRAGRMVYETFLPDRAREDLQQVARAIPEIGFEAYHHDDIYVYQPNAVTWNHLGRAGMEAAEVPIGQMPLPWSKVILQQKNDVLLRTQQYMLERWGDVYEVIFSNLVLLELTRKGSNKGGMVDYLVRYLGMDPQKVYCVGDNQNDIPMLARSAIPFAPANCAPEVKDWGARVLCSCQEGCVAQVVEELARIYA